MIEDEYEFSDKDVIGHGAFAVVYKSQSKKNPSSFVAIKSILKKNLAKSQNLLGKEIKILKELNGLHHKNVVALLDCKEDVNHVYLVMEYCNGGDLSDYLNANGTLSEDTIRIFLIQLAEAMRALYAKGIVHRDLKPQNILLSHSGTKVNPPASEITLKIADFGFARFLQEGVMAATLCGSPMYMAPEVIMSLKYDAKADLWSLGTIIFQCLTAKPAFVAQTPQALKQIYELNAGLAPRIPRGTSAELSDLLLGMLKRNAKERINFQSFFNHPFLKRPESPECENELLLQFGSPTMPKPLSRASPPIDLDTPPRSQPESPRSTRTALSSSPEDDYVIVPKDIQIHSDHSTDTNVEKERTTFRYPVMANTPPYALASSPTRPCSLPISEPIPVPTQRKNFEKMHGGSFPKRRDKEAASPGKVSGSVPRSMPITMKNKLERQISEIDISTMSPPSIQFVIGTPPGGRRRSTSGSLCETSPPPNVWTVSPVSSAKTLPINSPLKIRSGTSPPILSGPLARVPLLSSPNLNDNNNLGRSPIIPFCTRAVTLPDISELDNFPGFFNEPNDANDSHPIMFFAPELQEETLFEKAHNDTLAKLNFVLALSTCVLEMATQRAAPLSALAVGAVAQQGQPAVDEASRRAEQLVLMVRALQLLSSGLSLATGQLGEGILKPSANVRNVVTAMNTKFKETLKECKQLNGTGLLNRLATNIPTAEMIMYNHAIQMCQSAALDELFGHPEECFQRYQTAQILLHSLSQHVHNQKDTVVLNRYRDAVEKRLLVLQQRGVIIPDPS